MFYEDLSIGIHPDCPRQQYIVTHAASPGRLKDILVSPAYMQARRAEPFVETSAVRQGKALATLLEGGEGLLDAEARIFDQDRRTKAGKAAYAEMQEWVNEEPNRYILTPDEYECAYAMAVAISEEAADLLAPAQNECAVVWREEETGITCKMLADYWDEETSTIIEIKSTGQIDRRQNIAADFRYHVQAAMGVDGFNAAGHLFIWVEQKAPYQVIIEPSSEEFLAQGMDAYLQALTIYDKCLRTDQWPKRKARVDTELDLPAYYRPSYPDLEWS